MTDRENLISKVVEFRDYTLKRIDEYEELARVSRKLKELEESRSPYMLGATIGMILSCWSLAIFIAQSMIANNQADKYILAIRDSLQIVPNLEYYLAGLSVVYFIGILIHKLVTEISYCTKAPDMVGTKKTMNRELLHYYESYPGAVPVSYYASNPTVVNSILSELRNDDSLSVKEAEKIVMTRIGN